LKKILSDKGNVKEILHETVVNWIDEGLFTKDFIPLYKSKNTDTCNEIDTKKPHNEIFLEWLKIQTEQKKIIQDLMDTGKLEIQERSTKIHDYIHTSTVILGESIYNLESNLSFVLEYKKQIDELIYFAYLVEFIKNNEFVKSYRSLLSYKEIYRSNTRKRYYNRKTTKKER